MNRFNSKTFLLIILAMFLSYNVADAIVEEPKTSDETTAQQSIKTKPKKFFKRTTSDKKVKKEEPKKSAYSNDVHSVFKLEDCVKIAVENNPEIQSSIYNAMMYKTKIVQAWANYFPELGVGVAGEFTRTSAVSNRESQSVKNTLGYLPNVSANWLLFDFGKTKATADMAKRTYEAKQSDTSESINDVICNIKTAYYNVLFAQAQVKVYQDTVDDYKLQLKRAQSFYDIGKKPKIDVITAEYNLGKAQLNLVKAQNILEVDNVKLAKIMGIPEYTNFELSSQLGTDKYAITEDEAINKAFEVRPELIAAKKTADAAKMKLRAAKREWTPDLGFYGSYGNGIGNNYNTGNYQLGVGLNYTNINMLRVKKQIDEADAGYKKAIADYDAVKHTVYLNVKKSYLELKTCEDSIIIAKLALDQAKEQYRQVSGRYKAGVGDIIELKDGETTFLNARLDFYNALLNYNVTAASLEKEIGLPIEPSNEHVLKNFN